MVDLLTANVPLVEEPILKKCRIGYRVASVSPRQKKLPVKNFPIHSRRIDAFLILEGGVIPQPSKGGGSDA